MGTASEFIHAALPWILIGLLLAVFFGRSAKKKRDAEQTEDHGIEGMCLGMSLGTAFGAALGNNTGIGMILGMLIGLAVGSCFPKKKKADESDKQ